MATIVPITAANGANFVTGRPYRIRTASAQASTGQTDWFRVPDDATYMEVIVNVTATAGTTPICLPSIVAADPITLSDTNTVVVGSATTTGITSTGETRIVVGPGVTGIADAVAVGTTGGVDVKLNTLLSRLMGVKVLNDRTTGDETYTYTVTVTFR